MERFEFMTLKEAREHGCPDLEGWEDEYVMCIVDTEAKISLGTDGGEPEDQSFSRDWSWVVGAMNAAHAKGVREAAEKCDGPFPATPADEKPLDSFTCAHLGKAIRDILPPSESRPA